MLKPVEVIQAMKKQEEKYITEDYLKICRLKGTPQTHNTKLFYSRQSVVQQWRSGVVEWCYHFVSIAKFSRDTVAISMNYLDRFLATPEGIGVEQHVDRFQLAAMTCLYMAVKVHECRAIKPKTISALSRSTITEQQVIKAELKIAIALEWRLNPPTPLSFVRSFLRMIPETVVEDFERETAAELATCQTELAVREHHFISYPASTIALAAIANAMKKIAQQRCGASLELNKILQDISKKFDIDLCSRGFIICRETLWILSNSTRQPTTSSLVRQSSKLSKTMKMSKLLNISPRSSMEFHTFENSGKTLPNI